MELEEKISKILWDYKHQNKTNKEATDELLLLFKVSGCDHYFPAYYDENGDLRYQNCDLCGIEHDR